MLGESSCIKQNINSKTETETKYTIGITKNEKTKQYLTPRYT